MSEAIFGLVGVLIGSGVTWGIELWRARRSDADAARVAARLVADELRLIYNARTIRSPELRRQQELALQQDAWITHRPTLARALNDERWRVVGQAYVALAGPERSPAGDDRLDAPYTAALRALKPSMSSDSRFWWQRLRRRLRPRRRGSTNSV